MSPAERPVRPARPSTPGKGAHRREAPVLSRVWRLARLPLVVALLGAVAGVAAGAAVGPSWQVESTVAFTPTSQDPLLFANANSAVAERELAEATSFVLSQDVLTVAARALGTGERWTDLQDALTATPQPGSNVITLTGSADDAERATARVRAVTTAFADRSRQRVVEEADRTAAAARASAQDLPASQRAPLDDIAARAVVAARTADPVRVLGTRPPVQTRPVPWRDGATGAVLGLVAASAVLVLVSARPSRVMSGRDAGELLGLPWGTVRSGEVAHGSEGLVEDLRRLGTAGPGPVVVVPAGPASVGAADEVAVLLRGSTGVHPPQQDAVVTGAGPGAAARPATTSRGAVPRVAVTGAPSTNVVAPLLREAAAVVLAVERGAPTREVRTAKRLSEQWTRPPDAVVVTT